MLIDGGSQLHINNKLAPNRAANSAAIPAISQVMPIKQTRTTRRHLGPCEGDIVASVLIPTIVLTNGADGEWIVAVCASTRAAKRLLTRLPSQGWRAGHILSNGRCANRKDSVKMQAPRRLSGRIRRSLVMRTRPLWTRLLKAGFPWWPVLVHGVRRIGGSGRSRVDLPAHALSCVEAFWVWSGFDLRPIRGCRTRDSARQSERGFEYNGLLATFTTVLPIDYPESVGRRPGEDSTQIDHEGPFSIVSIQFDAHPAATMRPAVATTVRLRGQVDRYSFLVRLFHPLLHACLSRRT